jgi:hypothetical protein
MLTARYNYGEQFQAADQIHIHSLCESRQGARWRMIALVSDAPVLARVAGTPTHERKARSR